MKNLMLTIIVFSSVMLGNIDSFAQRNWHGGRHGVVRGGYVHHPHRPVVVRARPMPIYPRTRMVMARPRIVRPVAVLPIGYTTLAFRQRNYYYHSGFYYNNVGGVYNVIAPPVGIRIGVLPVGYRKVFIGPVPHYYYMGTYYKEVGPEYEVVEPALGTVVPELPQDNVDEVTIDGQTYYEYDNILYKSVVTNSGVQYEVVGKLAN